MHIQEHIMTYVKHLSKLAHKQRQKHICAEHISTISKIKDSDITNNIKSMPYKSTDKSTTKTQTHKHRQRDTSTICTIVMKNIFKANSTKHPIEKHRSTKALT